MHYINSKIISVTFYNDETYESRILRCCDVEVDPGAPPTSSHLIVVKGL